LKQINKVLILFIFSILICIVAAWEVLQSNWVADNLSIVVTRYLESEFKSKASFSNLSFTFFPPGAEVTNFKFDGEINNNKITAESGKLGVYFNPFDVFNTQFTINNIAMEDGVVRLPKIEKKSDSNDHTTFDFEKIYDIPVKSVSLSDVYLNVDKYNVEIKKIKLTNRETNILVTGEIQNIDLLPFVTIRKSIDSLSFDGLIDENSVLLNSIILKSEYSELKMTGRINSYLNEKINYNVNVDIETPLNSIHDWLEFEKIGKLNKGMLKASSNITGEGFVYQVKIDIIADDINTDFIDAKKVIAKVNISQEEVRVEGFELFDDEQKIKLDYPFQFYNFKTKKLVEEPIRAEVAKLQVSNFLKYFKDSLSFMSGSLTGDVKFDLKSNGFNLEILKNSKIDSLKINGGDSEIISLENFELNNTVFELEDDEFRFKLNALRDETMIPLVGVISPREFLIEMTPSFLDVEQIKNIANLDLKGRGVYAFKLNKVNDSLVFDSNIDFVDFEILGYWLDKVKSKINFNFDSMRLDLPDAKIISGETLMNSNLRLDFEKGRINGNISGTKLTFSNLKRILNPLLGELNLKNSDIQGFWDFEGRVDGGLRLDELLISAKLKSGSIYIFEENFENPSMEFSLQNQEVKISNLIARKSNGKVEGQFKLVIPNRTYEASVKLTDIPLQDSTYYTKVPLNLRGNLNGNVELNKTTDKFTGSLKMKMNKSFVFNEEFPDSSIIGSFDGKNSFIQAELFGKQFRFENKTNWENKDGISYSRLNLEIPDIKSILSVFSGVDILNNDISGSVKYDLYFDFSPNSLKLNNYNSNMRKLVFQKKPISISYTNPESEIIVKNSVIEKWDTDIRGENFYVLSKGSGNLGHDFDTTTQVKIDASILEIFNNIISKSDGSIRGKFIYGNKNEVEKYEANLTSSNLSFTSKILPISVAKSDFKISYKDQKLIIEKFIAQLLSGELDISGSMSFEKIIPDINIRYEFKNAGLTILDKSNLTFSGNGSLIGKTFPYTLGGDFNIQKLIIINEITDFMKGNKNIVSKNTDYLPETLSSYQSQILNFNLNVVTREPIYIRNSLADIGFVGSMQILGDDKNPQVLGKINLAPRRNKISFKNNEFLLTKGSVFFIERNKVTNPLLDFVATSNINNYKLNLKVLGPVDSYNLDLSSDPSLSQSDILSLIAFGYTEDLSNNLSDSEKESMTRAGVGSIIFDSFKINETLKNEFGLQINLGTAISKEEGSYLSQRNAEGATSVGRINSATTFEIKKKLNDAMSLSVSSTVGNSSAQKQSMNLNYNINNNISVEGVYESKSKNDIESLNDDNSVGADVKWKWSFK